MAEPGNNTLVFRTKIVDDEPLAIEHSLVLCAGITEIGLKALGQADGIGTVSRRADHYGL